MQYIVQAAIIIERNFANNNARKVKIALVHPRNDIQMHPSQAKTVKKVVNFISLDFSGKLPLPATGMDYFRGKKDERSVDCCKATFGVISLEKKIVDDLKDYFNYPE